MPWTGKSADQVSEALHCWPFRSKRVTPILLNTFLFWFACVNALVPFSTFSQSQRRRLNNDAKNSRKLLPWQFILAPFARLLLAPEFNPLSHRLGCCCQTRLSFNCRYLDEAELELTLHWCVRFFAWLHQQDQPKFLWSLQVLNRFDISRLAQPLLFSLVGASIVVSWPHSCRWCAMFHSFLLFVSCTTWLKAPMFSLFISSNFVEWITWLQDLVSRTEYWHTQIARWQH